ncbi:glycosyltransferase [Leptolyngbya sp. DQ-M1]|uniref:glycosyltransferase n=1 Tax=Leptolyngbya sp. DQ-M1 TaxID=2933920 RepID=UPI0032994610
MLSQCDLSVSTQSSSDRTFLLFDLSPRGHHPVYFKHLVKDWSQQQRPGCLHLVVSPALVKNHPDLIAFSTESTLSRIRFSSITEAEYETYLRARSLVAKSFIEWKLFCRYAKRLNPTQALLMYLDSLQLPLAFGERSPCPVSGIYFRPSFHYHQFSAHPLSAKEQWRQWRQKAVLARILRRSQFKTLFCLDRFAVPEIQQLTQKPILPLADPVEVPACQPAEVEALRRKLQILPDRHLFLLFGELSGRKGVYQVLQALKQLPIETQSQLCLVLAGSVNERDPEIRTEIEQLKQITQAQIVLCDRYIKGAEVQQFFELADTVLALYQKHVGMSSILVHAAAAHKPVLSTNYGLMGAMTQQNQLGQTVDSENPAAIAKALQAAISQPIFCKLSKMNQVVDENRADQFVSALMSDFFVEVQP